MIRDIDLESLVLQSGAHVPNTEQQMCVMEAVAFVAGEPWSDHPACASRVIGAFLRSWNDAMSDEDRQMLKPLIPRLVGTAASDEIELRRSYLALDWYCRVSTPAWLRMAGLTAEAEAIEATPPIVDAASAEAAQEALGRAKERAYAAESAAGSAAGAAAWAAAGSAARSAAESAAWAAAWAAAGAAAWAAARSAAESAAWAAAESAAWAAAWAAAESAARSAAWAAAESAAWAAARSAARSALRPTVEQLQKSALDLVERMIAVGAEAVDAGR